MNQLLSAFETVSDLLDLEIEELAAIVLPNLPTQKRAAFTIVGLMESLYPRNGGRFPHQSREDVEVALAEAIEWLRAQGLVIRDPGQSPQWFQLTRRGQKVRTGSEFELYRRGQVLPAHLLQDRLVGKVRPLFLRGDHDTAVFQAFKEVEVAVRKAGGFSDDDLGRALMAKAFNPESGTLRDTTKVLAERESEFFLFSGAIGYAKNPTSHRDVSLSPEEAARLIVFAAELLDIVQARAANLQP